MSPNGLSSGFDESFFFSSSDSSDSEFFLQEDIKNPGNQLKKQWEEIERTLYQEPGQQVTDPKLLKECKLWRETFPHFRIKGTKIDVKNQETEPGDTNKNVQAFQNSHINLRVLDQKRQSIKKKVVGALVDRLIAKFGAEKRESAKSEREHHTGVEITEIDDLPAEKISGDDTRGLNSKFPTPVGTPKESYFERGKSAKTPDDDCLTTDEVEKKLYELFDSWEEEKTAIKPTKTAGSAVTRRVANPIRDSLALKSADKPIKRMKPRKSVPSSEPIGKPVEIANKIDKKYEGLIERIMERQQIGLGGRRHSRTSSSGLEKSYQESLAQLRLGSGFSEHYSKQKTKPRLNKLSNNWLERGELNSYNPSAGDFILQERSSKPKRPTKSFYSENMTQNEIDEKFLEELKTEMARSYRRPPRRSGVVEEISTRRPKPFRSTPEISLKPSGFGESTKRNKKEVKSGVTKRAPETGTKESNVKSRIKTNNCNKGGKMSEKQSSILPPIETGIICTELIGRPKIGPKIPPKRL